MKKKIILAALAGTVAGAAGYAIGKNRKRNRTLGLGHNNKSEKNALIVTSVASMIDQFTIPSIKLLIDMGYNVDVATNFVKGSTCPDEKIKELIRELTDLKVDCYHIDFDRKAIDVRADVKAFKQVDAVVRGTAEPINTRHHHINPAEGVKYSFIHSHSPIGGVVGRIIGKKYGVKNIYTAHGFHFYDGAPRKNWLIFYPIEKELSRITDVLITINQEDYKLASEHFHSKKTVYIPGVGVDTQKFNSGLIDVDEKRAELGVSSDTIMLLSVGELIDRKNHEVVIHALPRLNSQINYYIAGIGEKESELKALTENLGVEKQVHFLGFRKDISELCQAADIFVFPSHQEGVSLALMEAIACKTPVVCSRIRGNTDLVTDEQFIFDENNVDDVVSVLTKLTIDGREQIENKFKDAVEHNYKTLKMFDLKSVEPLMKAEFEQMGAYSGAKGSNKSTRNDERK